MKESQYNLPNFNQISNSQQNEYITQNQIYNQNANSNIWETWVNFHKNPLFFKSQTPEVYVANFSNFTWNQVNEIKFDFPLYSSKAELPDGSYLITGGDNDGEALNTCYFYNSNGQIIQKNNMNNPRKIHSSIYLDGYVYVFGGFNPYSNKIFNNVEKYDIKNDIWINLPTMNVNRAYTTLLRYGRNYIFLIGGVEYIGDNVNFFYLFLGIC